MVIFMTRIIEITHFDAPELDVYTRLNEAQLLHIYEPDTGLFIAESPKVIERALDAGYQPISFLTEPEHITGEAAHLLARTGDVPVYTAAPDILTKLTGFQLTRGTLCAMRRKPLPDVTAICKNARRIAVLENVVNPTNVGAIFRSAAALGMDAVLLTPACSNPLYRRALRVGMGTPFQIPWTYFDSKHASLPTQGLTLLKELGFKTAAMALSNQAVNINDPGLTAENKLAILLGAEGDGLSPDTITNCDYTVCIPMSHGVDSLNVAAAGAVAFWQLSQIS